MTTFTAAERREGRRRALARKQRLANVKARRRFMDAPSREFIATSMKQFRRLYRPEIWARMSADERRRAWRFYKFFRDVRPIQDPPSARELARLSGARNIVFLEDYALRGRRGFHDQ